MSLPSENDIEGIGQHIAALKARCAGRTVDEAVATGLWNLRKLRELESKIDLTDNWHTTIGEYADVLEHDLVCLLTAVQQGDTDLHDMITKTLACALIGERILKQRGPLHGVSIDDGM